MLSFTLNNLLYKRCGLVIFLLQLSLFVLILKPFQYGTWYLVEPTMMGLLVLGAVNAIWLAIGLYKGWLVIKRPLPPLLTCMLLWVGWQVIATLMASSPWRSWFGPAGLGEGAAFYTGVLLSYLLGLALWQVAHYRVIILAVATFNLIMLSWANFYPASYCHCFALAHPELLPAPGDWADYLAFVVGYLWIAFMVTPSVRTPTRYGWLMIISTVVIVGIAGNKAALFLMIPAMTFGQIVAGHYIKHRPEWLNPDARWRWLATLACLIPLIWIAISQDKSWASKGGDTIPMRALYNQVSVTVLEHEPWRLLKGDGWGTYQDDLFRYMMVDGIHAYYKGMYSPNWEMVDQQAYHAHNEPMQLVLSLGIPGLLLWLALPVIVLWTLPKRRFWWAAPMLVAIVWLQSLWFFLPLVMGYQALMLVALTLNHKSTIMVTAKWPAIVCAAAAGMMMWSVSEQWKAMEYGVKLSKAMVQDSPDNYSVDWLAEDIHRGGDRFRPGAVFYAGWAFGRAVHGEATERDVEWYRLMMETAHRAAMTPHATPWLASVEMTLLNRLFMNTKDSPLDALKPRAKDIYPEAVVRLSELAPEREDRMALFLSFLKDFTQGDDAKQVELLEKILVVAPRHRAALWLLGQKLLAMPGREEEGRMMMLRAKELGVDRVFPIW